MTGFWFPIIFSLFALATVSCQDADEKLIFCNTTNGRQFDGLFSYNYRVFVFTSGDEPLWRLQRISLNLLPDSITRVRTNMINVFNEQLASFNSGFAVHQEIPCIPDTDLWCNKKRHLLNMTMMFDGAQYYCFRPTVNNATHIRFDLIPEPVRFQTQLMPFGANRTGQISALFHSPDEHRIRAAAYHQPQHRMVFIVDDQLWSADVVESSSLNGLVRADRNPAYSRATGAFITHDQIYFVIDLILWQLVSGSNHSYSLRNIGTEFHEFFGCPRLSNSTTTSGNVESSDDEVVSEATEPGNHETPASQQASGESTSYWPFIILAAVILGLLAIVCVFCFVYKTRQRVVKTEKAISKRLKSSHERGLPKPRKTRHSPAKAGGSKMHSTSDKSSFLFEPTFRSVDRN